jgi:hypothetical protein
MGPILASGSNKCLDWPRLRILTAESLREIDLRPLTLELFGHIGEALDIGRLEKIREPGCIRSSGEP